MESRQTLSPARLSRMRAQGYSAQNDTELSELAFGNRFAYKLCTLVLVTGVITAHLPTLTVMMIIAFFGVVLPNHPFDYIYNYILRQRMGKPHLPKRANQIKFACLMASPWIGGIIYLFSQGYMVGGYALGGSLIGLASLVGWTDICIPSILYNALSKIGNGRLLENV